MNDLNLQNSNEPFEPYEDSFDFRELFFKCLMYWPWFIVSVLICLGAAWFYLRHTVPVYNITATVLVKDEKKGGNVMGAMTELEELGLFSTSQNIDNEIEVLRSKSLIKDVVTELNLYTTYFVKGRIRDAETYKASPVQVELTAKEVENLKGTIKLDLSLAADGKLKVITTIQGKEVSTQFTKLPAVWSTELGTFTFLPADSVAVKEAAELFVYIAPPLKVTRGYAASLTVEPTSKTTSVATLSLKNTSKARGEYFINKLIDKYNQNTNDDKNEITRKSAEFIDERISIINEELGTTEDELAQFKQSAGLTNLNADAQIALAENSEYEKQRVENGTQLSLVRYLTDYINNPKNENNVIPVNVGLKDASLSNLITRYNEIVLEHDRLLRASSENNPVVIRLSTSIRDMKENISTTITSVQKGLLIAKADIDRQAGKYAGRISDAPTQERKLVGITRQQDIKASLYIMLLKKREENAIALAATANNAKIIDRALSDEEPVSPKRKIIYLIALFLGVAIPVGYVYLKGLLQFKLEGISDLEKITTVPLIGEIPLVQDAENSIAVHENKNDMMAEVFRDIRTNLQFMLGDDKKVILVTSTISGEGKTFAAANLAISFALLGKKTVIVGLDIRKPGLNKVFQVKSKREGITNYLANPTRNLLADAAPSDINENLFVLPAGVIPPNPTELLARANLDDAISLLKSNFDYVILDTAPIGMITDTKLISRTADICIYICRADYTYKSDYALINDLQAEGKLNQLCTIINGIDYTKKKYGYNYSYEYGRKYGYGYGRKYGYGYGRKYGYGYGRKYGYGYGYGQEVKQ